MKLDLYVQKFGKLKTDKSPLRWDERTRHRAPHKPLLLLSMLDRFAEGAYTTNLIEFDDNLSEIFAIYWTLVDPPSNRGNIAMPLYHLESDKFWHLLPRPGFEERLEHATKIHSIRRLREWTLGARLDDALFELLSVNANRNELRRVLIRTYFVPEIQEKLFKQAGINLESFYYSQDLIGKVKGHVIKDAPLSPDTYQAVRDQGFKRTIRRIYNHYCAICNVRIETAEGRTAVIGAHIIPWSVSHNDDPRNGIALCPLCHWIFDVGLFTITHEYKVSTSPHLKRLNNNLSHLAKINRQPILLPEDADFYPDPDSLAYHAKKIYRER